MGIPARRIPRGGVRYRSQPSGGVVADQLDPASVGLTGVNKMDSVPDAIRASVARSGDTRIAVIPEGPYVVPQYVGATP